MLELLNHVGRHFQRHRKVACLPSHLAGVKDVIRDSRMKRTFKYRVYPTLDQQTWLFSELKHQKKLYNYMLQMRSQMWNYGSISVSMYDQINHLAKLRENSHYGKQHTQDMQVSIIKRVDKAFQHFFRRCKEGSEKKRHSRFKRSVRSLAW